MWQELKEEALGIWIFVAMTHRPGTQQQSVFSVLRFRKRDILEVERVPEHGLDEPLRVFGHDFEVPKKLCCSSRIHSCAGCFDDQAGD